MELFEMDWTESATRHPPLYQFPSSIQPEKPPPNSLSLGRCSLGQWLPQYSRRGPASAGMGPAKSTMTECISRGSSHMSPFPSGNEIAQGAASNRAGVEFWARTAQMQFKAAKRIRMNLIDML